MKLSHTIHSQHKIHWCVILDKQYGMCSISFFLKKNHEYFNQIKNVCIFCPRGLFPHLDDLSKQVKKFAQISVWIGSEAY